MGLLMELLALILKCVTAYTAIMGILFLLPRRKTPTAPPKTRFAVVVAARNEEAVIGELIESVHNQNYPKELCDVFVIPNNCTDDTAGAAWRSGARLLACQEAVYSKGDALRQGFRQLLGRYDAYCIFDADNLIDPDFLSRMNDAVADGALAAKGRHIAMNPYDSWVAGCYELYFENFDLLYNRPRAALGLSAKLAGTGFMVTDKLLQQLGGWNTVTIAEDAEFAAQCAMSGVQVRYVPEAVCYDEEPTTFRASLRQRQRWSSGVLSVAGRYLPDLLRQRPTWLRLDFTVFISMIYVQLLALLPVCYRLSDLTPQGALTLLTGSLVSFWLGLMAMALFLCAAAKRDMGKMWKTILLYPLFTASWYPLHIISVLVRPQAWKPIAHTGSRQKALR